MYLKRKTGVRNKAKTLNYFAYAVFSHADFWPFLSLALFKVNL